MIFINPASFLIAALVFTYIVWRELKDDYIENQIFGTTFYIFMGIAGGLIIASYFYTKLWFWGSFVGAILGLFLALKKFGIKGLDIIDSLTLGMICSSVILLLTAVAVRSGGWQVLYLALILFVIWAIYLFLKRNYKGFIWYKSGKVGFPGISVIGLAFLVRTIIAILSPDMLSFVGRVDAVISGIVVLLCLGTLYNISKVK